MIRERRIQRIASTSVTAYDTPRWVRSTAARIKRASRGCQVRRQASETNIAFGAMDPADITMLHGHGADLIDALPRCSSYAHSELADTGAWGYGCVAPRTSPITP